MGHINSETLNTFLGLYQSAHWLLQKPNVTQQELINELTHVRDVCKEMARDWQNYLGYDDANVVETGENPYDQKYVNPYHKELLQRCQELHPMQRELWDEAVVRRLYSVGNEIDLTNRSTWVAIVGPRKATPSERAAARWLAERCVRKGFTIVSGLAMGVDEEAHRTALQLNGQTIAIVATSPDEPLLPRTSRSLGEKIRKRSCTLHLFNDPIGERARRYLERDILIGYLCPTVVAVTDRKVIKGGTRWAVTYGKHFGAKVYRYDSTGEYYENPATEHAEISWDMEFPLLPLLQEVTT